MTPGQAAGYVLDTLTDFADATEISDEDLQEKVQEVLDRLFEEGYPDVVAEAWRRAGLSEDRVFEAVAQTADRLNRDQDMCLELTYGDWG